MIFLSRLPRLYLSLSDFFQSTVDVLGFALRCSMKPSVSVWQHVFILISWLRSGPELDWAAKYIQQFINFSRFQR